MVKIRHLSEIHQGIAFTEFDFYQRYAEKFKTSELGRIRSVLPLRQMAISFNMMGRASDAQNGETRPKALLHSGTFSLSQMSRAKFT